jgi:hypothetical protein
MPSFAAREHLTAGEVDALIDAAKPNLQGRREVGC